MKIIVAVDSFKGSLTSQEVAWSVEQGIRKVMPDCDVIKLPLSDGGEGLLHTFEQIIKGERIDIVVSDPLGRPVSSYYSLSGAVAVVEMALSSGLTLLSENERNPLISTTKGMGQTIVNALKHGCNRFVVGIGGSATNDAGIGMLRELGFRFLDIDGKEIIGGGEVLERITAIDDSEVTSDVRHAEFTVACDVKNPFYGENGAACVYAPQKGADPEMVRQLDRGLRHFADVIKYQTGMDLQEIAGSGAAGGVGGAFVALLGAKLLSGIDFVLESLQFDDLIADADLVITGEGRIDKQTLQGKVPMGVLRACQRQGVKVIALAGVVSDRELLLKEGFSDILSINPVDMPVSEAMQPETAKNNVRLTVIELFS